MFDNLATKVSPYHITHLGTFDSSSSVLRGESSAVQLNIYIMLLSVKRARINLFDGHLSLFLQGDHESISETIILD